MTSLYKFNGKEIILIPDSVGDYLHEVTQIEINEVVYAVPADKRAIVMELVEHNNHDPSGNTLIMRWICGGKYYINFVEEYSGEIQTAALGERLYHLLLNNILEKSSFYFKDENIKIKLSASVTDDDIIMVDSVGLLGEHSYVNNIMISDHFYTLINRYRNEINDYQTQITQFRTARILDIIA